MPKLQNWREIESEMHWPWGRLALPVSVVLLLAGSISFVVMAYFVPPGIALWIGRSVAAILTLLVGIWTAKVVDGTVSPPQICHADPDVLPNVPQEPVLMEGSIVHGRVTHELVENSEGWEFSPVQKRRRTDKRQIQIFAIPFMVLFAGLVSWIIHDELGWPISIFFGVFGTIVCGGPVLLVVGMVAIAGYRQLCYLRIPRTGDDLDLESPEEADLDDGDGSRRVNWIVPGETKRKRQFIPREKLIAVQLCPWKFVAYRRQENETEIAWAVQGMLVVAGSAECVYTRLPILLTCDVVGAAQLMQRLATTLHVPFLYHADAEGWRAEELRAKKRPPLKMGRVQS